ncbi:hypothetical protein M378DRAFT_174455 [Amanita muscaria Koide BX008]|uniref:Uncharacterized protein n=1 Tax=Amanita muscaria (strain Koide BX008) TaxID=946122 RepID=A0A0C2RUJ4_AMAMK|nr:hypothetical protein M378DRAFT_174528 [Amanita muscaria Koide BX008]KIL54071.1 hypothetical protein M378DRAFT_174455 [Amanita muscaria Koide BX008]
MVMSVTPSALGRSYILPSTSLDTADLHSVQRRMRECCDNQENRTLIAYLGR